MAMVPGVAVLKTLQWGIGLTSIKHTAVQALEQHHNKELAAEQELHDLLGHASHLSPPEMAKAAAANACRQHQLKQQRDIFTGRVTKLLQVSLTHVLCGIAATFYPLINMRDDVSDRDAKLSAALCSQPCSLHCLMMSFMWASATCTSASPHMVTAQLHACIHCCLDV